MSQVAHPKLFLFDPGVTRALSGRVRAPLEASERGALFESLVLHERRAHMAYSNTGGTLSYWRAPSGSEVDFVWTSADRSVGVEVKAGERFRPEDARALMALVEERALDAGDIIGH